jgi:hypothetical protein
MPQQQRRRRISRVPVYPAPPLAVAHETLVPRRRKHPPLPLSQPDSPRDRVAPAPELRLGDAVDHAPRQPPAAAPRFRPDRQSHDALGERRLRKPREPRVTRLATPSLTRVGPQRWQHAACPSTMGTCLGGPRSAGGEPHLCAAPSEEVGNGLCQAPGRHGPTEPSAAAAWPSGRWRQPCRHVPACGILPVSASGAGDRACRGTPAAERCRAAPSAVMGRRYAVPRPRHVRTAMGPG